MSIHNLKNDIWKIRRRFGANKFNHAINLYVNGHLILERRKIGSPKAGIKNRPSPVDLKLAAALTRLLLIYKQEFEFAVRKIASNEITAPKRKPGRPGLPDYERLAYAYAQVEAWKKHPPKNVQRPMRWHVYDEIQDGGIKYTSPTLSQLSELYRLHATARRLIKKNSAFAQHARVIADTWMELQNMKIANK